MFRKNLHRLLNSAWYITREIWRCKKDYFSYSFAAIVFGIIMPFLLIQVPGRVLEALQASSFRKAGVLVFLLCCAEFFNSIVSDEIKRSKKMLDERIKGYLNKQIGIHLLKIDFARLEDPKIMDTYQFATKSIDEKHITKMVDEVENFLISSITLIGVLHVFKGSHAVVYFFLLIFIISNAFSERFRLKHVYERSKSETPTQRQLLYARNTLAQREFAKEIRLFDLSNWVSGKVVFYTNEMCRLWIQAAVQSVKTFGWTYVLQGVQLALIYLYFAYKALSNVVSVADFTIYMTAVTTFNFASAKMVKSLLIAMDTSKYVEAIQSFLKTPVEQNKGKSIVGTSHVIQFEDVSFRYPNKTTDALSHVSITIYPNKKYAIVGENGAGKTTFIKLLLGLYKPTSGQITIDGEKICDLQIDKYRQLFSVVFQDFNILGFSLKENVSLSKNLDELQFDDVINRMRLDEIVQSLPHREDTVLSSVYSETGVDLSGGERQKVAIARALYREAPYLVLDEPSAALSPKGEFELYNVIQEVAQNRSSIFISHRLASCKFCDEIYVFSAGKIAEHGNHEELINKSGIYRTMFDAQASLYSNKSEDTDNDQ